MPFRFLKHLFRRHEDGTGPEPAGPLAISPGDEVEYYQRRFVAKGILVVKEPGEVRHQYHLEDGDGRVAVLVAERDRELVLSLQEPVSADAGAEIRADGASLDGVTFRRTHEGTAATTRIGELPEVKTGLVDAVEFEDDDQLQVLVSETWGPWAEVRAGPYVFEGEITIRRPGDDDFEVRPPTPVDARVLNDARRAREEDERRKPESELDAAGRAYARRMRGS